MEELSKEVEELGNVPTPILVVDDDLPEHILSFIEQIIGKRKTITCSHQVRTKDEKSIEVPRELDTYSLKKAGFTPDIQGHLLKITTRTPWLVSLKLDEFQLGKLARVKGSLYGWCWLTKEEVEEYVEVI